MSKAAARTGETEPPRVWTQESVDILLSQVRYMLQHEARSIKLEIVESIGAALARRSGIDKQFAEMGARLDALSRSVEGFAGRLAALEAVEKGPARKAGPLGRARDLTAPAPTVEPSSPAAEPEAPGPAKRKGRPKGSGRYSRMRLSAEGGAP